ncbi:hypothetical protein ACFSTE_22800 [Aquimarina hainanensis]|uniref:DUF4398 domain-containing protein n=1 Tax=Aquimarina hainanensis TaxID=1578017 RepID=A0ABW5NFV4_9FLAO|nr:hypothetical protein [Aquimarina sp. TRL1]QKX03396.1 hypothetical protein HN014_00125 [Aquimarina sp. TRL1]
MKKIALTLFLLCFIPKANAQNNYDDALTAASYAYSHTKKAHGANNVFHTQEYADKAIESYLKVEELSEKCGCTEANKMAYEARVDLESSLEQDTYERSRFYVKRVKEQGSKILEVLTNCQANSGSYSDADDVASLDSPEDDSIAEASMEVARKQKELEEKRRQLEIEQQKLQQQIAEQNKKKAEFEAKRLAELKEQTIIKNKAELALQKLENALQELSVVLNENSTFESNKGNYIRPENALKNESLGDTKTFYIDRAKELTKTAMQQFASSVEN